MNYRDIIRKVEEEKKQILSQMQFSRPLCFGDVKIGCDTDFSSLSDEKLVLCHSVVHTKFETDKKDRELSKRIHSRINQEMKKRGMEHKYFDRLDN